MRENPNRNLQSKNDDSKLTLMRNHASLERKLNSFTNTLTKLQKKAEEDEHIIEKKLQALRAQENKEKEIAAAEEELDHVLDDCKRVFSLIKTLKQYIKKITYTTIFDSKMGEKDIAVLKAQVSAMENVVALLIEETGTHNTDAANQQQPNPESARSTDSTGTVAHSVTPTQSAKKSLSQLFADASKQEYDISKKKIWLRRAAYVLTGLAIGVGAIFLGCLLMTPVGHVGAAITATFALIHFCKPAVAHTTVNVDGIPLPLSTPITAPPSSILMGPYAFFRWITGGAFVNNARETAARNLQAATINKLTDALIKKIKDPKNGMSEEVRAFLLGTVKEADAMYNEGVGSRFYESQSTKMQKAREILHETAKIVESGTIPTTVNEILSNPVGQFINRKTNATGEKVTYGHILNIQRNCPHFFNQDTQLKTNLIKKQLCTDKNWPTEAQLFCK